MRTIMSGYAVGALAGLGLVYGIHRWWTRRRSIKWDEAYMELVMTEEEI